MFSSFRGISGDELGRNRWDGHCRRLAIPSPLGGGSTVMPQTLTASPLTLNYFKGGEEEGNSASRALT